MNNKYSIDIISEINLFIKNKIYCFRIFKEIAFLKKELGHSEQYKTEKWLQAELLIYLWSKNIKCIPEYKPKNWDIFIPQIDKKTKPIYIDLKCFTNSSQSVTSDFKKYQKDIEILKDHNTDNGHAYIILLLPFDGKKYYRKKFEELLRNDLKKYNFLLFEKDFKFNNNKNNLGISSFIIKK